MAKPSLPAASACRISGAMPAVLSLAKFIGYSQLWHPVSQLHRCDREKQNMTNNSDIVFPAAARLAQAKRGSARTYEKKIGAGFPDRITPDLAGFIAEIDMEFLAIMLAEDAPYIYH